MKDFTIMSAQASVEARFDDPIILEGYGFSFFGTKGYTFSPIWGRNHMVVQFQGHFVEEIPDDRFTVVLKKVRGEDAVPLFQTLTFHINIVHPYHHIALYEMFDKTYQDYISRFELDQNTAMYILASVVCLAFVAVLARCYRNRQLAKQNSNSIEAFSYNEALPPTEESEADKVDVEAERNSRYQNLAGNRPTTPAVF